MANNRPCTSNRYRRKAGSGEVSFVDERKLNLKFIEVEVARQGFIWGGGAHGLDANCFLHRAFEVFVLLGDFCRRQPPVFLNDEAHDDQTRHVAQPLDSRP